MAGMIQNLQILRAFAALNVVLFHILLTAESYALGTRWLRPLDGWGANGVDIFFVISGFVMLHTQRQNRRTPAAFFRNRLIRIAPLYWALTLCVIGIYIFQPALFREMVVTPQWAAASLLFVSKLVTNQMPVVQVGWTLEWEMFFYATFALALFAGSMRTVVLLVVLTLGVTAITTQGWIAIEFLFGMLVAWIYGRWTFSPAQGIAMAAAGLCLLCLSLLPRVQAIPIDNAILWGVPATLIVLGAVHAPELRSHLLAYLGDASYSIYLIQFLAIPAFYKLASRVLAGLDGDLLALCCLAFCALLGCCTYAMVERPLTRLARRLAHPDAAPLRPGG